ncbi:uncharacterized protein [Physcomitrium patens]|uniref:WRKY domain-containing protein n=3 Tax=Physcomitrium patens TaxID=3218 RepID=A0A7I4CXD1_PHYPA|nr:uncharacterized protein LOC112278317 isoform X1 [Physcomitrium patens]|eukprot:XP_024367367.1 uncharacterized protein LOC112278317 isoform X1 [Physcomitrella patens]
MSFRYNTSVPRLKGDRPEFERCVQTVKEMLSTAIVHQRDLLNLVVSHYPQSIVATPIADERIGCGVLTPEFPISPLVLQELKAYIENSLNYCHLALCSLREINLNSFTSSPSDSSPSTLNTSMRSSSAVEGQFPPGWNTKFFDVTNHAKDHLSPRLNVVAPLNSLRSSLHKDPLPYHSITTKGNGCTPRNSGSPRFTDPFSQPPPGEGSSTQQQHPHEQNLNTRLLAVDSNPPWPRISSAANSEARKFGGQKAKPGVVLQKLNDGKRGIPDDGHRGWKKYGNKAIQNSNHCRGYYKCSLKECRAKKMVQLTDRDPTLFEVTYVGKHSCSSSTAHPRCRHRSTQMLSSSLVHVGSNGSSEGGQATSTVTKEDRAEDWKTQRAAASIGTNLVVDVSNPIIDNGWKGGKYSNEHNYSYSYFNMGMTTSTTASTASEEPKQCEVGEGDDDVDQDEEGDVCMDTYLHQSSRHHQAAYSLWHDFDTYPTLSTD